MPNKKFTVVWSQSAAADLKEIILFIAEKSPKNARSSLAKIKQECLNLENFPNMGKIPNELKSLQIGGYRELVVAPRRLFYRTTANSVIVLGIIDSRRDLDDAIWNRMMRLK